MNIDNTVLNNDEKIIFNLRSLYSQYGYSQFKMNKFEEYDMYVANKDFLVSDNVITFTDTNGKLMALKPDVTLSIIKNTKDIPGYVQKLYYNENVYRISKGTNSFKEIMQVGLECIGDIDQFSICEVLLLAAKSLKKISKKAVLDISNISFIAEVLDGVDSNLRANIVKCLSEKNLFELKKLAKENNLDENKLSLLITLYGKPSKVLPQLKANFTTDISKEAINQFEQIVNVFEQEGLSDMLRIDFSVVNTIKYYNGIVFKGFVEGVPNSVLSGGQYDKLLQKMSRRSKAIGFAVYLDILESLDDSQNDYDVDILIVYDNSTNILALNNMINMFIAEGQRVIAQRGNYEKLKYRKLVDMTEGGKE